MAALQFIKGFYHGFFHGPTHHKRLLRADKKARNNLGEAQVNSMIDDSFPASDPPSTY